MSEISNSVSFHHVHKKPSKLMWRMKQVGEGKFDFDINVYDADDRILWGEGSILHFPKYISGDKVKPE